MSADLTNLVAGAGLNLAVASIIVRGIYYRVTPERNYVFSFLAFNTVIYFVMALLTRVEIGIGIGFGLFAIFSVLRYRTEETPFREMTYLFVVIALPVMNAMVTSGAELPTLLVGNALVIAVLFVLEQRWGFHYEERRRVSYERLPLIAPARREELLADLRERTGLPVTRVEVVRIDLVRDTAELNVYFPEARAPHGSAARHGRERRAARWSGATRGKAERS